MKTLTSVTALLMAGTLAACGNNTDAPVEAPDQATKAPVSINQVEVPDWQESVAELQGLADEVFSLDDALEADMSAITGALPEIVSVSWDEQSFDETTGATIFTGLTITIETEQEFGITAEEASVWGLNTDLIAARLNGEQLDEEGLAFNRLEASNVSYFGVTGAVNALFDTLEREIEEESEEEVDFDLASFETTASQMVMSNVTLRPFEYVPVSDTVFDKMGLSQDDDLTEEEAAQKQMAVNALRAAQQFLAVGRSLSVEDAAVYDTVLSMAMSQPGVEQTIDVSWDFYGYEDLNGFDIGRAVVVNTVQSQSMTMTDETGDLAEAGLGQIAFDQVEEIAFTSYEDLELDKLAGFLARGEFPSMDERDLMSLGTMNLQGYSLNVNDEDVFAADRVSLDADSFAWLIPEELGLEMEGAEIGLEAAGNLVLSFIPPDALVPATRPEQAPDDEDSESEAPEQPSGEEALANLRKAIDKLDEHGLGTVPFNSTANWSWGADSGATDLSFDVTSEGFGKGETSLELTLPAYEALQAAYEAEDKEAAFQQTFMEAFAFGGLRLYEADEGGYDKLFAYAREVGKLYPNEGWGAMIGGMEPAQMRTFIATMIRSGKGMATQEFPPAGDWIDAIAAYYETPGGSIEIESAPGDPVTIPELESLGEDTPPEEIVERLGLSVTHTPE